MSKSLRYQVVKLAKENSQLRGHLLPLVTGKTANDDGLRMALTKLAYENPSLRSAVLPLVKNAMEHKSPEALKQYLKDHPNADKRNHSLKRKEKSDGGGEKGGDKKEWKSKLDTLTSNVSKQDKKLKDTEKKLEDLEKKCKEMAKEKQEYLDNEEYWIGEIENHDVAKKLMKEKEKDSWRDLSKEDKQKVYDIKESGSTLGKLMGDASNKASEIQSEMWQLDRDVYDYRDDVDLAERKLKRLNKELKEHQENEPSGQGGGGKKKEKPAEETSETSDNSSAQPQSLADKKKAIKDSLEKRTDLTPKEKDAQKKALEKMSEGDIDKKLKAMGDEEEEVKTSSLKHQLVRLAHSKPHLRKHILPLLK